MDSSWQTWTDLNVEYRDSFRKVSQFRENIKNKDKKNTIDEVGLEISGSMKNDLYEMIKELDKKVLYELNALKEEDFKGLELTDKQKEIASLRLKYNSYTKIAEILGLKPSTVFKTYKSIVKKIGKYKERNIKGNIIDLSDQQAKIYSLKLNGRTKTEIAEELGISVNSVKTQLRRIKQKLSAPAVNDFEPSRGGDKNMKNSNRGEVCLN